MKWIKFKGLFDLLYLKLFTLEAYKGVFGLLYYMKWTKKLMDYGYVLMLFNIDLKVL